MAHYKSDNPESGKARRAGRSVATSDIDLAGLRAYDDWVAGHPDRAFVDRLRAYACSLIDESDLPRAAIALEMMASALFAFEDGLTPEKIADAYPVERWKKDTVTVPRDWLLELVQCWLKYKDAPDGSSFGEAFQMEGGGQGRQPVRKRLQFSRDKVHRRNETINEYLKSLAKGKQVSWDAAIKRVAEAESVSEDTVKRTMDARRDWILAELREDAELFGSGKAS